MTIFSTMFLTFMCLNFFQMAFLTATHAIPPSPLRGTFNNKPNKGNSFVLTKLSGHCTKKERKNKEKVPVFHYFFNCTFMHLASAEAINVPSERCTSPRTCINLPRVFPLGKAVTISFSPIGAG